MRKRFSLLSATLSFVLSTQLSVAGDFNQNGHADVLWQKDNGKHSISMMENGVTESTVFIGRQDWSVQSIDDFNHDGYADILWQRDNGNHIIWMLRDGNRIKVTRPKNPTWSVQSTNDFFNSDGDADILWKNADGDHVISEMVNGVQQSSLNIGNSDWSVESTDDFNGDGHADILWKNADGDHEIWEMINGVQQSSLNIGNPNWSVKGTDDFNGDGDADILWRNINGDLEILMMNDGEMGTAVSVGNPYMCVQGTDDFNNDGDADIIWKDIETGDHLIWMMDNGVKQAVVSVGNPDWSVQPGVECVEYPKPGEIVGTGLACEVQTIPPSNDAGDFNSSKTFKQNISSADRLDDPNRENPASKTTFMRLGAVVPARDANGILTDGGITSFHPLVVSYTQQYLGDYELGLGSADVGDPTHVDAAYFAISQDDGQTWKNIQVTTYDDNVSNEANKSSITVDWNGDMIEYPAHVQKPKMAISGNKIVVAWHDKFCPSGNPLHLTEVIGDDGQKTYPDDYFSVNGLQGSINYSIDEQGNFVPYYAEFADKYVYEVPFSCVWTARGTFNPETGDVAWHAPMQLTSGTRDSNHIWIEGSEAGFAMAWQEDTVGLKSGKGAGPGEGWSGATTNKGSDIWYTSMKLEDFEATLGTDEDGKLKSANNFHYPVRITDNEQCQTGDKKPYCNYLCDTYGFDSSTTNNNQEKPKERCLTSYTDMLDDRTVVLDGDTGASRSALKIFKTDVGEHVVVLGYEETKALSVNETGVPDQDSDTNISAEGKAVYFESFLFDAIDDFNGSNPATIEDVQMPLVSSGKIVNVKSPDANDTSTDIYENARRVVIGTQVDSCDGDRFNFAFMYKQSFDVQGASSDMFIRVNNGFTYDSFVPLDGRVVTNISAQAPQPEANATSYEVDWSVDNLDDYTYENPYENTFSPRIFLRGNTIYTGFEYKAVDGENMPANFHVQIYDNGAWRGPLNITKVTKESETTVDARFLNTAKGSDSGLDSDQSNPDVLFVTWGNIDFIEPGSPGLGKAEADLFYTRSTNNGLDWDDTKPLAAKDGGWIEEKEIASFASPDGKTIYNVWIQEQEEYNSSDPFSGLDTWFGRVDYDIPLTEEP